MSSMKWYAAAPLFLLAFVLQTTVLWRIPIYGWSPNLLLCLVVVFSFLYEEKYGLTFGIIFGLLLDFSTQSLIGVQTITFILTHLLVTFFGNIFNREKIMPNLLMSIPATLLNVFGVWGIYKISGSPVDVMNAVESLPALLIMHAVIVLILHLIFVKSIIKHRRDRKFYDEMFS